jgi:hypothetical protein
LQASWGHVRQAAAGLRLRAPLSLADCRVMAAVCPEIVGLHQHHRSGGSYLNLQLCRKVI